MACDIYREVQEMKHKVLDRLRSENMQGAIHIVSHIGIKVSNKMTSSAGIADYRKNEIRISRPIFEIPDNRPHLFNTVTHEIAHLLTPENRDHGLNWRAWHRFLGGNGKRTHSLIVPPKRGEMIHVCPGCRNLIRIGRIRAKRLEVGESRYRHRCGALLSRETLKLE